MKYQVSFFENKNTPIIEVVQGDSARVLQFEPTDYEIPEGAVCTYYVKRPSNVPVYNTATIENNIITVDLTAESLAEVGENRLQVRIEKNDKILTSFTVVLVVREFGGIGAVESSPEANVFDQAVASALNDFESRAETVAEAVIESIPADYTELSESVEDIDERLEAIEDGGIGISEDVKQALLACFENVAWKGDDGKDYYDALEEALYPPANLISISAQYTQTKTIYSSDSLDDLRDDLVVVANYAGGTTEIVTGYLLSGTLMNGTSIIIVTYGGKTTTISVTVSDNYNLNFLFSKITLSDGYIDASGNIVEEANSVYLDEGIPASAFCILKSDGSEYYNSDNFYLRLAEYDVNGDFIGRNTKTANNKANAIAYKAESGTDTIKVGCNKYSQMVSAGSDRFVALNPLDTSLCVIDGKSIDTDGSVIDGSGKSISDFLPINEGYLICLLTNNNDSALVVFYDEDYDLISRNAVTNALTNYRLVIAVPNNAKYVRFRCDTSPRGTSYVSYRKVGA